MTNEQAKEYIKKTGEFPPGRTRCMDCRCQGKGECPGATDEMRYSWRSMMNDPMQW